MENGKHSIYSYDLSTFKNTDKPITIGRSENSVIRFSTGGLSRNQCMYFIHNLKDKI